MKNLLDNILEMLLVKSLPLLLPHNSCNSLHEPVPLTRFLSMLRRRGSKIHRSEQNPWKIFTVHVLADRMRPHKSTYVSKGAVVPLPLKDSFLQTGRFPYKQVLFQILVSPYLA